MKIIFRSFLLMISIFIVCGCSTLSEWKAFDYSDAMPWVSGNKRTKSYSKSVFCLMCPTGNFYHYKLIDESGWSIGNPADILEEERKFLGNTDIAKTWPFSNRSYGFENGPRVIAPYEFYLVSVKPTLIVMVYKESDKYIFHLERNKKYEKPSWQTNKKYDRFIENKISLLTMFPFGESIMWFSKDLKVAPTPVIIKNNMAIIRFDSGEIVLNIVNGVWVASRNIR